MEMHGPLLLLLARWIVSPDAVTSTDKRTITFKAGEDVTLTCVSNKTLDTFEWRKSEMKQDKCVFRSRGGRALECNQDLSFHGRVVRSNQSTNRSASIVLKNTSASDAGTYECRVASGDAGSEPEFIYIVELKFEGEGNNTAPNHGDAWSAVGIAAIAVIAVGVAVLIFRFCCRGKRRPCSTPEPNNPIPGEEGILLEESGTQTE